MKKKDILMLIEYQKNLLESTIGIQKERFCNKDFLENPLEGLYPDIKDLEEEFAIISKEFKLIIDKRNKCLEYIKKNKQEVKRVKCSHPIIFEYNYGIGCVTECAVCGKKNAYNPNSVSLIRYNNDIENCAGVGYNYYALNSNKEKIEEYLRLYNLIHGMLLDKSENEEIDFTRLFAENHEKYNIGSIYINSPKKECKKILIITGTNAIKVLDNTYLTNNTNEGEMAIEFLKTFDNCEIITITSQNETDLDSFTKYRTIDELKDLLQIESNNKIDIVFPVLQNLGKDFTIPWHNKNI